MVSRLLLRLIDEAILPAVFVVVAKIVAVIFLIQWLHLNWKFDTSSVIPGLVFEDATVGLLVNSYSNLFLFFIVLLGLGWVLAKAYHFHDTHVSPQFVLKLLSWNLSALLTSSSEVYHQGLIWMSYLWLVTLLIGFHVLMGMTYLWVFIVALVGSLLTTWLFVADVEREIEPIEW